MFEDVFRADDLDAPFHFEAVSEDELREQFVEWAEVAGLMTPEQFDEYARECAEQREYDWGDDRW